MFPLWAESERRLGGLDLPSDDVGQVLAITDIVYGSSDYLPMYSTSQRALVINNAKYCINVES